MEVLPKESGHFIPFSLEVNPSGLPTQNLDTQKVHLLNVVLLCNVMKCMHYRRDTCTASLLDSDRAHVRMTIK